MGLAPTHGAHGRRTGRRASPRHAWHGFWGKRTLARQFLKIFCVGFALLPPPAPPRDRPRRAALPPKNFWNWACGRAFSREAMPRKGTRRTARRTGARPPLAPPDPPISRVNPPANTTANQSFFNFKEISICPSFL